MEKRQCDKCDLPATHHAVEISDGQKIEKHLCDLHAAEDGLAFKGTHKPIDELLTNFVKLHSQRPDRKTLICDHCGLSYQEFQEHSLLGCPNCYDAFDAQLTPLLERAHENGDCHLGKIPTRAGDGQEHQAQMLRMRKRLDEAIIAEDYELAAHLRDEISQMQETANES